MDEFSFKKMRTWGQSKISYSCICVWCESGELGRKWVDCKCMKLVAAGWRTKKWLRFDHTIRNFTFGDADFFR